MTVNSVGDLRGKPDLPIEAYLIALDHLERGGYPERTAEWLGRALSKPEMHLYWERLEDLYRRSRDKGEATGLAVALAELAKRADLPSLRGLISDKRLGPTRIFFVRPILRFGGKEGKTFLQGLESDPDLQREISAKLSPNPDRW
ncbi:hypothetical protein [Herbiconiux liukaitaii]|uniref:hypothetical protein n=1 Tax=Herbiconiux liukaitaii TaxID=3342799 RepID=UPI0035B936D9